MSSLLFSSLLFHRAYSTHFACTSHQSYIGPIAAASASPPPLRGCVASPRHGTTTSHGGMGSGEGDGAWPPGEEDGRGRRRPPVSGAAG